MTRAPENPARRRVRETGPQDLRAEVQRLREKVAALESRIHESERRRRAMLHIMTDLSESNRKLSDQRKAMLHILVDYEAERNDLAEQTQRLQDSRRAFMHILSDAHDTNLRLGESRKAMIHIMDDLHKTTEAMRTREQELRQKQEQLVQAAKLATLGELTTGVAHELNNPLNNIGLYIGNVLDALQRDDFDRALAEQNLQRALQQVTKATAIISHLRTFGRAAPASREPVEINGVIESSISLLQEQFRLRGIEMDLVLSNDAPVVLGNAIQLEQVLINLLTNARDAMSASSVRRITISSDVGAERVRVTVRDTGPGIPPGLEQRIFDPFFTTKEVGEGTGLGLSIVYGIIKDHDGSIDVKQAEETGAAFVIELPLISREVGHGL